MYGDRDVALYTGRDKVSAYDEAVTIQNDVRTRRVFLAHAAATGSPPSVVRSGLGSREQEESKMQ